MRQGCAHCQVPSRCAKQRWGRKESVAASLRYNTLARDNGMTPHANGAGVLLTPKWQVASTIIGVTTLAQLEDDINAYGTTLTPETLAAIDAIRAEMRDPALLTQTA